MEQRTFVVMAGVVFALVAIAHLVRAAKRIDRPER